MEREDDRKFTATRPSPKTGSNDASRARQAIPRKEKSRQLSGTQGPGGKVGGVDARLIALQMKYDIERQLNVELKSALAARLQQALPKQTKSTREILNMKKTIHEIERIVSAYSAEINRLRDELTAARKSSGGS